MILSKLQILECNDPIVFLWKSRKPFHLFYSDDEKFFKKLPGEAGYVPLVIHKYDKFQGCIFVNIKNFNIFTGQQHQWKSNSLNKQCFARSIKKNKKQKI